MSRWLSIASVLGLVGLGVGPAYAQSTDRLRVNIPFEFKVGHATLPAGSYDVSYDPSEAPGILVIRGRDGHHDVLALTEAVDTHSPGREPRLVFEREGSVYTLSEVFAAEARTGLEVVGTHPAD